MGTEDLDSNVVPIPISPSARGGPDTLEAPVEPPGNELDAPPLPPSEATQAWLDAEAVAEQALRVALGVASRAADVLIGVLEGSPPLPRVRTDPKEPDADDVPAAMPGTIPLVTGAALGFGLQAGRLAADTALSLAKMAAPFISFAASPRLVRSSTEAARERLSTYNRAWEHDRPRTQTAASEFAGALVPEIAAAVLDQLDLTEIVLERVDFDRVVARVDLDGIVERIDLEAIITRIDVTGIASEVIEEIDLSEIIRESSGALAGETVEGLRIQGMNADRIVGRVVDRVLLRRRGRDLGAPGATDGEPDGSSAGGPKTSDSARPQRTLGDRP